MKEKIYTTAIAHYGASNQMFKAVEECAELIQALAKGESEEAIITEIADVQIMCQQLSRIFGMERVAAERKRKIARLYKRMRRDGSELPEMSSASPFLLKNGGKSTKE